jgi:hypothetical protein
MTVSRLDVCTAVGLRRRGVDIVMAVLRDAIVVCGSIAGVSTAPDSAVGAAVEGVLRRSGVGRRVLIPALATV